MADQARRVQINTDLRPAYYDDFRCLAADCRYSCCKGWRISFNKKDYLGLKRQEGSPEFNARMEAALRRIRKDPPPGDYGEFDMHTGVCPLLREDGLCGLQAEKGAGALPAVCQRFPRSEGYTFGYFERALSPACEAVLGLLWDLRSGVEFRSGPLPREKRAETVHAADGFLAPYFPVIREWCIDALQDRRHTLPDRLMLMGMALKQLADGEEDIPAWLGRARTMMDNAEPILPREPEEQVLRRYLSQALGVLLKVEVYSPDFAGLRQEILQGMGAELAYDGAAISANIPFAPYRAAAKRYEERFAERDHFMENLMVTLLFYHVLPDTTTAETLWKSYVNFCNLYSFYRFMAVMSCRESAPGDRDELFRLLVFASRALVHSLTRENQIRDEFFQNDSATLAHMAILLCG